ncbi:MAG: DUF4846 domain-containing protein [Bacteroidota bacterium]
MMPLPTVLCFTLLLACLSCQPEVSDTARAAEAATVSVAVQTAAASSPSAPVREALDTLETAHLVYPWLRERGQLLEVEQCLAQRIAPPAGYVRSEVARNSFADWLRHLPLQAAGAPVRLYDGRMKTRQDVHAAVVDIDVGARDLQQCADAVMRLRAEYLYGREAYEAIHFNFTSGDRVSFDDWRYGRRPQVRGNRVVFGVRGEVADNRYSNFKAYLKQIFNYAGTASLSKELRPIRPAELRVGDVFILGGFPGHAVLVVDVVENGVGDRLFLLAQSYMPAQNIHILKNPNARELSPWYPLDFGETLRTPEWTFTSDQLYRFSQ